MLSESALPSKTPPSIRSRSTPKSCTSFKARRGSVLKPIDLSSLGGAVPTSDSSSAPADVSRELELARAPALAPPKFSELSEDADRMQQASTSGRRNAQDTTGDEHPATLSLDDRLAAGERRSSGSRRDVTQEVSSARAQQVGTQDIAADADAMGRAEQRGRRNSTARNEKALQRRISKLEAALTRRLTLFWDGA